MATFMLPTFYCDPSYLCNSFKSDRPSGRQQRPNFNQRDDSFWNQNTLPKERKKYVVNYTHNIFILYRVPIRNVIEINTSDFTCRELSPSGLSSYVRVCLQQSLPKQSASVDPSGHLFLSMHRVLGLPRLLPPAQPALAHFPSSILVHSSRLFITLSPTISTTSILLPSTPFLNLADDPHASSPSSVKFRNSAVPEDGMQQPCYDPRGYHPRLIRVQGVIYRFIFCP